MFLISFKIGNYTCFENKNIILSQLLVSMFDE